jgi:hypothetical protein
MKTWVSEDIAALILNLDTRWSYDQLHAHASLPLGKEPPVPIG